MGPRLFEVVAELHEPLSFRCSQASVGFAVKNGDPLLDASLISKPLIPPSLELGGDQTVVGVDRVVLALGPTHFELRLSECELDQPAALTQWPSRVRLPAEKSGSKSIRGGRYPTCPMKTGLRR